MTLGKKIAEKRRELGLRQEALAEKLNVSAQAVSKWENDQSCPDIQLLPKLAALLGTTVDALLSEESASSQPDIQLLPQEQRRPLEELVLRVKVLSADGDKVRVNLPMALVKVALETGMQLPQIGGNEMLKNIDLGQIMDMAERGLIGRLVEVESADGDTVEIVVE